MRLSPLIPLLFTGCSILDFGGNDAKAFEFRFGWDKGISVGHEDPTNPGFDRDGNLIPPKEVEATYKIPDLHAGYLVLVKPFPRSTPSVGLELAEVKIPVLRWFSIQIHGGDNLVCAYLGKRLLSIFEISVGIFIGRDLDENDWAWGVGGTIIRF